MPTLATLPAVAFLLLTGAVNVRFAYLLAGGHGDAAELYFWIAVGLTAAFGAAIGLGVAAGHWRQGARGRAAAAAGLFVLCFAYDVFAGYGLSKHLQLTAAAGTANADALEREASRLEGVAAGIVAPEVIEAEARMQAVTVSEDQCAEALGQNTMRREAAERVRAACAARAGAVADLGKARAREAARGRAAEARARAASARLAAVDPRTAIIGAELAAWLPVVLVSVGAVLAAFAGVRPPPKREEQPPKREEQPPKREEQPPKREEQPPKREEQPPKREEPDPVSRLRTAARGGLSVDRVAVEDGGSSIKGPQRALAQIAEVTPSTLNRALAKAHAAGQAHVGIRDGVTVVRFN